MQNAAPIARFNSRRLQIHTINHLLSHKIAQSSLSRLLFIVFCYFVQMSGEDGDLQRQLWRDARQAIAGKK